MREDHTRFFGHNTSLIGNAAYLQLCFMDISENIA